MKTVYSIFSFVFFVACFVIPFTMMNTAFFGTEGDYFIITIIVLPVLGIIFALIGAKGAVKIVGMTLNGLFLCVALFLIIVRTMLI